MILEHVVERAFERIATFSPRFPTSYASLYRRIGVRQQLLFARASRLNPERFGTSATALLDADKAADLMDIAAPVPTPEIIERVTIEDKGTSAYENGDRISIVGIADPAAGLPPRMTLRDLILRPVGADLAGVTSIRVWYPRLSPAYNEASGPEFTELPEPHDELLVTDIARMLLQRAPQIEAAVFQRAMEGINAEEAQQLAQFDEHVATYGPWETRFARPPQAPARSS